MKLWRAGLLGALFAASAIAAEPPLTLDEAIRRAEAGHPELLIAQAEIDLARADQEVAGARDDLNIFAEGALRRVRPGLPENGPYQSDNSLRLNARKNLYDFGRTRNAEEAAAATVSAREAQLLDARDRRRIEVMERFFDVLQADRQYSADNEYMSVAYVHFDQLRERYEQKLVTKLDLAEAEARFQEWRIKRNESEKRQRLTRALLANAMNRPGELPTELVDPKLPRNDQAIPDYEVLLPLMLAGNTRLQAQQKLLEGTQGRMAALRSENLPTLDLELEAANYAQRPLAGRDDRRAGLVLNWPLYQGARVSGQLGREQAQFQKLQAETERLKRELTNALLTTWAQADQLQNTVRNAARVQADYRDLALERARGEYEVELKTNLGTSMAATVEANLQQRAAEYRLALALARLEALIGQPLPAVNKK